PVDPLPAALFTKGAPERFEALVGRGDSKRPSRLALVSRILDVVVRGVDLMSADPRVVAAAVLGAEASRVHLPGVESRRTVDDPFGQELSHPTRTGDTVRAEPRRHPKATHFGRSQDELTVGREGLRAVDERD